ncbi:MAG: hypothetical protein AB7T63_17045 [Planctomycetota bacterium]
MGPTHRHARGPKQQKWRWNAVTISMVGILGLLGAMFLVGAIAIVVQRVSAHRTGNAAIEAAVAAIGTSPTVASILSSRSAFEETARREGGEAPRVFATIQPRATSDGRPFHVVAFVLCTDPHDTEFERELPQLLSQEDLAALQREGLRETTGDHWKHHRHRAPPVNWHRH